MDSSGKFDGMVDSPFNGTMGSIAGTSVRSSMVVGRRRWVAESAFPTLRVGQLSGPLSISFRNAGSQSWIRGTLGQEARLAVNQDNAQWAALGVNWLSANRVASQTEATVVPGGVGTFTFQVRAPMTPGLYAIHLRPVIDAVTWMEDEGVFLYITVTN